MEWLVEYRWPGLWHSLRSFGHSSGALNVSPPPEVIEAHVILEASAKTLLACS